MKLEVPLSALVGLFGMAALKAPSKPDRLKRTREQAEAFADGAYDVIELWCF